MARDGLLIGEVAAKSGVSRKALRLYERAGILPPARRTASGYRVYGPETLAVLRFVSQARRLGFRLDEIKRIVVLKRSGQSPCSHVADLVHMKLESIQQTPERLDATTATPPRSIEGVAVANTTFCCCLSLHRTPDRLKGREVTRMENRKVLLCPAGCGACPEVEFAGEQVKVGEAGNLAVLTKDEWNVLVDLIQSGELTKI